MFENPGFNFGVLEIVLPRSSSM